jgi:hypothetical protein
VRGDFRGDLLSLEQTSAGEKLLITGALLPRHSFGGSRTTTSYVARIDL